jgi:DNA-binding MarR family transcriptional regulator
MADIKDLWLFANNIIRTSRQIINEELRPLNLSSAEGNILLHLLTQNDESAQEAIVEQLDVSKPAVSRALVSLVQKGYVVRQKEPADRRASRILLTDKARLIAPQIEQIYNGVFAIAAQGISEKEIADFIGLFSRVSESFSRARAERPSQGRREWR